MTRREFVALPETRDGKKWFPGMSDDMYRFQQEIDALPPAEYGRFRGRGLDLTDAEKAEWFAKYPALRRYDEAYDKVFREAAETTVTGPKPAVWYIYNMGILVKTRETLFTVDLCHRQDLLSAPLVDFACVTHNHGDHFSPRTLKALDRAHKLVYNNFFDNAGALARYPEGGYSKRGRTYAFKDVKIETHLMSHNYYLQDFTIAFEITVGDYVIYHTGDSGFVHEMRPTHPHPDLWVVSAYCYIEPVPAVRQVEPKLMMFAHLQELGHAVGGGARSTWGRGLEGAAAVKAAGYNAIVPVWGERIV